MSVPYSYMPHFADLLWAVHLQSFKIPNFQNKSVCIPLVIGNTQRGYSQLILNNVVPTSLNINNSPNADSFLGESTTDYGIPETPLHFTQKFCWFLSSRQFILTFLVS